MATDTLLGEPSRLSFAAANPKLALTGAATILLFISVLVQQFLAFKKAKAAAEQAKAFPHVLQFPPSRRHALAGLPRFAKSMSAPELQVPPPQTLKARALSTTKNARPDFDTDNLYTPTGFSTQDLRKLGRFPDYAVLSGVRHPVPTKPEWDITKAIFRPFRPFRWGYHQHMALMKFEPDWWVELEQNYHKTMAARFKLLRSHPNLIFFHNPAAELATRELMEMVLQFTCKRYPQHFWLSDDDTILHNNLLKTTTDLTKTPALRALFDNIPEDYCLMLRNEDDGFYYLRAAMACSSVGWNIAQHRNKVLRDIHTHVPDYAEKMAMSMDRYFSKMPADQPVFRCSWSIEDYEVMFTTPELEENWKRSKFAANPEKLTVDHLRLRCDSQTLRRLPLSAAVVFNFKAVFTRFEDLRTEPYIPALLWKVLEGGKENLITYKCDDHVRRVAMEALAKWAAEQVEQGIVPKDWEVTTLDESPFYPKWEETWLKKQGFTMPRAG
ncbi:hypothetical protein B0T19DRAFT_420159 [Cercophora scortea]|uniref:Uncharacterized protein n=1 Tax=Cercophora scortea TaxID=314031 RepID=A0AAE0IZL4_9PEZI|nr:hypothetical protein B0T19DRAFT_420159 [Cercophora scortea]